MELLVEPYFQAVVNGYAVHGRETVSSFFCTERGVHGDDREGEDGVDE